MSLPHEPISCEACIEHAFQAYEHLAQLAVLLQHPRHPPLGTQPYEECLARVEEARSTLSKVIALLNS